MKNKRRWLNGRTLNKEKSVNPLLQMLMQLAQAKPAQAEIHGLSAQDQFNGENGQALASPTPRPTATPTSGLEQGVQGGMDALYNTLMGAAKVLPGRGPQPTPSATPGNSYTSY